MEQEENASRPAVQRVLTIFLLIAEIKPRILERDCRFRRKHLQYRGTVKSENVWRQIVFKVENADEFGRKCCNFALLIW